MREILWDSVTDSLKLLPFLYLSYLAVEYTEHRMSTKTKQMIYRTGKAGPLLGSLIGTIPQCGFAAAAAGLFAGGVVSPGTLLAVFLATSDETLPVMLAQGADGLLIVKVLAAKAVVATAALAVVGIAAGIVLGMVRILVAVRIDAQDDISCQLPDDPVVTYRIVDRVDKQHRINVRKRPLLPVLDLGQDLVGHVRDKTL